MVGNQGQERVAGVRRGEVRLALQEAWLYVFDRPGLRRPLDGDGLRRATAKSIGGVFFFGAIDNEHLPYSGSSGLIGQCRQ